MSKEGEESGERQCSPSIARASASSNYLREPQTHKATPLAQRSTGARGGVVGAPIGVACSPAQRSTRVYKRDGGGGEDVAQTQGLRPLLRLQHSIRVCQHAGAARAAGGRGRREHVSSHKAEGVPVALSPHQARGGSEGRVVPVGRVVLLVPHLTETGGEGGGGREKGPSSLPRT